MDFAKLISILSSCGVISLPGKSRQFFLSLRANPSDGARVCRPNVVALPIHLLFKRFVTLGSMLLLALCLPHLRPDCSLIPTQKVQAFTMGEHPPWKQLPQKTSYSRAPGERGNFARTSPCKFGSRGARKLGQGSVEASQAPPRANSAPREHGSFARTSPCKLGSSRVWKLRTYLPVQTWLLGSMQTRLQRSAEALHVSPRANSARGAHLSVDKCLAAQSQFTPKIRQLLPMRKVDCSRCCNENITVKHT